MTQQWDEAGYGKPKEKDGWSTSGPLVTGNQTQIVSLQVNFPKSDVYTVQFNTNYTTDVATGLPFFARPVATITWTVEGNRVTRQVDIGNAIAISGTAQAVQVTVQDLTRVPPFTGGVTYSVDILVTPGVRPNDEVAPIFRAGSSGNIAPGGSADIDIPLTVGAVSLFPYITSVPGGTIIPQGAVSIVLEFVGPVVTNNGIYDPYVNPGWVPLPPGTNRIHINNLAGSPATILVVCIVGVQG